MIKSSVNNKSENTRSLIMRSVTWGAIALAAASSVPSFAATFTDQGLTVQGVLRSGPSSYVTDGTYCARVTLCNGACGAISSGSGLWQELYTSGIVVSSGAFSAALPNSDTSARLLETILPALNFDTANLTATVEMD